MKEFWTFIGGVAVGILAVTGVFAIEEETSPRFIEGGRKEPDDEIEEETDDDERLIVRAS
jgi:hypothetical protein